MFNFGAVELNMRYPIKYLERLSGIKAHTIRIWEQRYGVLVPRRTSTNIRYYDDDQLRHLLNIVTLLDAGQKISEIASLSAQQVETRVRESAETNVHGTAHARLSNELVLAALAFDRGGFETYFGEAEKKFGFRDTVEKVLYPALRRVGVLWQAADMNPAQEHFISNLARQKLYSACDRISPRSSGQKYLLFLPEGEHHEIGLLYFNYLLLKAGKQTIYLGMDLPLESLKQAVKMNKPHTLVFFVVSARPASSMQQYLSRLNKLFGDTRIVLCAAPGFLSELKPVGAQLFLSSPDEAPDFLKKP